ncbi:MAG: ACT domain-containing protein [Chitinivibrionia bacterium]|nr:ACT domain-containing protein [Chitinivibrionia bacterium]
MKKISTLGPKDTFSDYATQKYLASHPQLEAEISYQKTIQKVFEDLSNGNCEIAVVPVENVLAGFVWTSLDGLFDFPVKIIEELILPIQLSFLSKIEHKKIKNIFVHPLAEGQCLQFLYVNFPEAKITFTDSNIDSFERINENDFSAAVVPIHIYKENFEKYPYSLEEISDCANNCTRFIVLQKKKCKILADFNKTSIIVSDDSDSPGILKNIANAFSSREINMTSIISRPTRRLIGKYHFFIDIEGSTEDEKVRDALLEISKNYTVKELGCYKVAK